MTPADFQRWKTQKREDILRYVPFRHAGSLDHDVWIEWVDPDTRESLPHCPFLIVVGRKACACAINETKPDICRAFWCQWAHGAGRRGQPYRPAAAETGPSPA